MEVKDKEEFTRVHELACEAAADYYLDPSTGRLVFTSHYLLNRGACCNSGCRHCPWGYKKGAGAD